MTKQAYSARVCHQQEVPSEEAMSDVLQQLSVEYPEVLVRFALLWFLHSCSKGMPQCLSGPGV